MRVLLTNNTLRLRAGSEMYLKDLAVELLRRGHQPVAYSPDLGPVADDLNAAAIPVVGDLGEITVSPDVIHGQHHLETMAALVRFRRVPAVAVCHGWEPWEEYPLRHPRIRRHVAVSGLLAERFYSAGVPSGRVQVIGNAVDLRRFAPRGPLPERPRKALSFSNDATETGYLPTLRAACSAEGISLDVVGRAAGAEIPAPEEILGQYDLVIASGRSALESMAVGCAVLVCDPRGLAGMATAAEIAGMRALNLGLRLLTRPVTTDLLRSEIRRYDASDATAVADWVRAEASLDRMVDQFEVLYRNAVEEESAAPTDADEESLAEAAYLKWLKPVLAERHALASRLGEVGRDLSWERARRESLETEAARLGSLCADLGRQLDDARSAAASSSAAAEHEGRTREALAAELAEVRGTAMWRARERMLASPALRRAAVDLSAALRRLGG